jgi:hypothetical protein
MNSDYMNSNYINEPMKSIEEETISYDGIVYRKKITFG